MADDAQAQALARGDILPPDQEETTDELPPASAAPEQEEETPSSDSQPSAEGGEAPLLEGEEANEDEGDKDDDTKDHRIPKSRFDEAVNRERERAAALERELAQFRKRQSQQEQAANFEESKAKVKELLKQHSSLLADGDLDKASDVMEEVLQLRDDMNTARAEALAANTRDATKNELRYDAAVERLESEYPQINPDAEEFDQDAVRSVQAMVSGLMQTEQLDPAAALVKAATLLLKPKPKENLRGKPSEQIAEAGLRRTEAQIDKNLRTAQQQPPNTKEVGQDHDAKGGSISAESVMNMSWEEFVKLPDSELSKMRGDHIS